MHARRASDPRVCLVPVTKWNGTGPFRSYSPFLCLVDLRSRNTLVPEMSYSLFMPFRAVSPNRADHAEPLLFLPRLHLVFPLSLPRATSRVAAAAAAGSTRPLVQTAPLQGPISTPCMPPSMSFQGGREGHIGRRELARVRAGDGELRRARPHAEKLHATALDGVAAPSAGR